MEKFNFKKRYGQNFLKNKNIIDKIVNSINPSQNDLIVEIGPGAGAITKELKKYNANLIAFEIDTDTKQYLNKLESDRTKIIFADFLESDILSYINNIEYDNLYFIGNLPYYITTPIIEKIISLNIKFNSLTIMIQKEVAERFLAHPRSREYGYMTVLLNYWFDIEKIVEVKRDNFIPSPNVDSTVVKLNYNPKRVTDYNKFDELLKNSFKFKRKTLNNNLKMYDIVKLEEILNKHGFDLSRRAEELDLDTFIDLANNI